MKAQDTSYTYFDSNWEECDEGSHKYYGKTYKNGDNLWVHADYFKNGQLQMTGSFSDEERKTKQGAFIYFNADGDTTGIYDYVDNKIEGRYIEFFENGKRNIQTSLIDGNQEGYTYYYHTNGQLSSEGLFEAGDRVGEWKYYQKNGDYITSEFFIKEYNAPCGYSLNLPARWIHTTTETYGKVHDGVSLDRIYRKGVKSASGEEQFYALDVICLERRTLTAEDVCNNMARRIDNAKPKAVTEYNGMTCDLGTFYKYKMKGDRGEKLVVLVFAQKKGDQIAQMKFSFEPKTDPEAVKEIFDIVNSLEWN